MCFYITATLPKITKLEEFRNIFNNYNMAFTPITNEVVQSQLRMGDMYLRATKTYCDCDTILGSLNKLKDYQTLLNSKKVKTLRKKKWTDEQIDKWIKEKLKNREIKVGRKFSQMERDEEIKRWMDFLHSLLDPKIVSRIGLLKHWYNKGLQNEEIIIKRTERVEVNDISPELLLNLEEDVLYEFFLSYGF